MPAAYTRQYKWLARMEDIELLPREVPDCNALLGAETPSDQEAGMMFTPEKVKKSAAKEKRKAAVADPDVPAKKTRKTPGMISITGNRRLLLLTIARACDANTGKTHASRNTLIDRAGLDEGGSTYDECTHDLQAAGLLRISWEYFPRGSRRWWHVEDDRLRLLVGSGIDPQILKDAVKAIIDGAVMAHVYPSPARIEETKRRLRGIAKDMEQPAKLNIAVAHREDDKEHKKPDLIITLNTGVTPVDVDDANEEADSEAIEQMDFPATTLAPVIPQGTVAPTAAASESNPTPATADEVGLDQAWMQAVHGLRDLIYGGVERPIPTLDSGPDVDSFNAMSGVLDAAFVPPANPGGKKAALADAVAKVTNVVKFALTNTDPFWRDGMSTPKVSCPVAQFAKYYAAGKIVTQAEKWAAKKAKKLAAPAPGSVTVTATEIVPVSVASIPAMVRKDKAAGPAVDEEFEDVQESQADIDDQIAYRAECEAEERADRIREACEEGAREKEREQAEQAARERREQESERQQQRDRGEAQQAAPGVKDTGGGVTETSNPVWHDGVKYDDIGLFILGGPSSGLRGEDIQPNGLKAVPIEPVWHNGVKYMNMSCYFKDGPRNVFRCLPYPNDLREVPA